MKKKVLTVFFLFLSSFFPMNVIAQNNFLDMWSDSVIAEVGKINQLVKNKKTFSVAILESLRMLYSNDFYKWHKSYLFNHFVIKNDSLIVNFCQSITIRTKETWFIEAIGGGGDEITYSLHLIVKEKENYVSYTYNSMTNWIYKTIYTPNVFLKLIRNGEAPTMTNSGTTITITHFSQGNMNIKLGLRLFNEADWYDNFQNFLSREDISCYSNK